MLLETSFVACSLGDSFHVVDGLLLVVERPHPGLDSGSTADPIMPSCQARKLIPGEVSPDGADDCKRGDVGDGKAGRTHELGVDQKALRRNDCTEISLGQRRRGTGEFGTPRRPSSWLAGWLTGHFSSAVRIPV